MGIGIFWLAKISNHSGAEFVAAQGTFASAPFITQSGDIYTIMWSTEGNYPNNEVVLKNNASLYPDAGVGAENAYDAAQNVYIHTARFRLGDANVNSELPVFALGQYTYQVKSSGLSDQESIISSVQAFNHK